MVLDAVQSTREVVGSNTNLGIALLVCPLAIAFQQNKDLDSHAVQNVLRDLTVEDSKNVYAAIRTANAGGLGRSPANDVADEAPKDLIDAMESAAERDLVASQYTNGHQQVFDDVVPRLADGAEKFGDLNHAIVFAHVAMMARFPDSLITRKCGKETALHSQMLAGKAMCTFEAAGNNFFDAAFQQALSSLDFWLRSDGNRRNPGTTADMIAAGLFVAIQNGHLTDLLAAG